MKEVAHVLEVWQVCVAVFDATNTTKRHDRRGEEGFCLACLSYPGICVLAYGFFALTWSALHIDYSAAMKPVINSRFRVSRSFQMLPTEVAPEPSKQPFAYERALA